MVHRGRAGGLVDYGVCALGVDVFVFGGMTQDGVETATAERYEAKTNTWRAIASLPAPACATACAAGDDCFVFAWGSSSPRVVSIDTTPSRTRTKISGNYP